jgi:hypothetical protein
VNHAVIGIVVQRLACASGCKLAGGITLPVDLLTPDFGDLDAAMPFPILCFACGPFGGVLCWMLCFIV